MDLDRLREDVEKADPEALKNASFLCVILLILTAKIFKIFFCNMIVIFEESEYIESVKRFSCQRCFLIHNKRCGDQ